MRKLILLTVLTISLPAPAARAVLLVHEAFDYSNGTIVGKSGGFGFTGAWSEYSDKFNPPSAEGSMSISSTDKPTIAPVLNSASHLKITGGDTPYVFRSLGSSYSETNSGVLWVGFLLRKDGNGSQSGVNDYAGFELSGASGSTFVGASLNNGITSYGVEDKDLSGNVTTRGFATDAMKPIGQTALLVARLTFNVGADDNLTLWLDPDLTLNAPGTTTRLLGRNFDFGTFNSITLLGGYAGGQWSIDELRIGNDYNDVAAIPEPGSLAICGVAGLFLLRRAKARRD